MSESFTFIDTLQTVREVTLRVLKTSGSITYGSPSMRWHDMCLHNRMFVKAVLAAAVAVAITATGASAMPITFADPVTIDFTLSDLSAPNNQNVAVQDYYNGGTDATGATGPNLGISFQNAWAYTAVDGFGISLPDPNAAAAGVNPLFMANVAAGFTDGLSLYLAGDAPAVTLQPIRAWTAPVL